MRKLEGVVKEIVDEMDYLKVREERFQTTNGISVFCHMSR
jgi:p24 family protein delta-1